MRHKCFGNASRMRDAVLLYFTLCAKMVKLGSKEFVGTFEMLHVMSPLVCLI